MDLTMDLTDAIEHTLCDDDDVPTLRQGTTFDEDCPPTSRSPQSYALEVSCAREKAIVVTIAPTRRQIIQRAMARILAKPG